MHMPSPNNVAPAQGLYQPDEFKDNCGFAVPRVSFACGYANIGVENRGNGQIK